MQNQFVNPETPNSFMRTPITWPGGKRKLLTWLLPHLSINCSTYCEPFGGSGAVLINRIPANIEIFNDLNSSLINFMRCAAIHPDELVRMISQLPYSRAMYKDERIWFKTGMSGAMTDLQQAARWFYLNAVGFSGIMGSGYGRSATHNNARSYAAKTKLIRDLSRRLEYVILENSSFENVITFYDRFDTLFYCDPPYVGTEKVYTDNSFGLTDHIKLAQLLAKVKGKVAVSYYPCELVEELYPQAKWTYHTRRHVKGLRGNLRNRGEANWSEELLICNYSMKTEDWPVRQCY